MSTAGEAPSIQLHANTTAFPVETTTSCSPDCLFWAGPTLPLEGQKLAFANHAPNPEPPPLCSPLAQVDVAGDGDLALLCPDLDGLAQHAWSPVHLNLVGQELLERSCARRTGSGTHNC